MSSWTTKVIEERFLQDDKIFTQNKNKFTRETGHVF